MKFFERDSIGRVRRLRMSHDDLLKQSGGLRVLNFKTMANPKSKPRRALWVVGVVVVLLTTGGGGVYYYKRELKKIITVQTEPAVRRNLTELVTATGKIQPVLQVKISPEVSGEIIELPVKEGQLVKKGDLLVKIRPDFYIASRNSALANRSAAEANRSSAEAQYKSSLASQLTAEANLLKAEAEFKRTAELFERKLVSGSIFDEVNTANQVAKAQAQVAKAQMEAAEAQARAAMHQVEMASASLKKAEEDLSKTTIYAPIDGTVSRLVSEVGERVVGTGMMAGTEIMTVAELNEMEARVEVGEIDVVLVKPGQKARLEVDSFRNRKFNGIVTQIANSARTQGANTQQEATKFEVRIRIQDQEIFRPGMSATAEIETRYRTNVLTVPIQSVTTRLPKGVKKEEEPKKVSKEEQRDKQELADLLKKKEKSGPKPIEVVFGIQGNLATMIPVTRGISDDTSYEILEGLKEGDEVITGSYKAIARELEDGKKIRVDNTSKDDKSQK